MRTKRRGGLWWLTVGWASMAAVSCAYQFFWSTFPVTHVDDPPGPSWLIRIGALATMLTVLSALTLVLLLPAGLIRLRHAWRLGLVWTGAVAAGVALEITFIGGYGVPLVSAAYSGRAVLDWVYLTESAGFLIVGASLVKILGGLTRARGELGSRGISAG